MLSRTRVFGIAMVLYAILSTGIIIVDKSSFDFEFSRNWYVLVGGLLILICGFVIAYKEDFDKMYAVGMYAVSFGIYKVLTSYSAITIDFKNFDITHIPDPVSNAVSIITLILGLSLILFGLSYLLGMSKKIVSKVVVSLILLVMNAAYFYGFYKNGDTLMMISMAVEIVILVFFILLLLSKDVRLNTEEQKEKNAKRIEKNAKKDADRAYKEAKAEAAEEKKAGNFNAAKIIIENAKKEKKETIAEGKEVAKNATKVRYIYNPETKTVEVKKDDE